MTVSSAKRWTLDSTQHGRSFIKIRNINGLSTDPWGTPDVTGTECECSPSRTTLCLLFSRKLFNHCNEMSSKPHLNNLYSKPLCGTLSNALLKVFMLAMNGYGPQGNNLVLGNWFSQSEVAWWNFPWIHHQKEGGKQKRGEFSKVFQGFCLRL